MLHEQNMKVPVIICLITSHFIVLHLLREDLKHLIQMVISCRFRVKKEIKLMKVK